MRMNYSAFSGAVNEGCAIKSFKINKKPLVLIWRHTWC